MVRARYLRVALPALSTVESQQLAFLNASSPSSAGGVPTFGAADAAAAAAGCVVMFVGLAWLNGSSDSTSSCPLSERAAWLVAAALALPVGAVVVAEGLALPENEVAAGCLALVRSLDCQGDTHCGGAGPLPVYVYQRLGEGNGEGEEDGAYDVGAMEQVATALQVARAAGDGGGIGSPTRLKSRRVATTAAAEAGAYSLSSPQDSALMRRKRRTAAYEVPLHDLNEPASPPKNLFCVGSFK